MNLGECFAETTEHRAREVLRPALSYQSESELVGNVRDMAAILSGRRSGTCERSACHRLIALSIEELRGRGGLRSGFPAAGLGDAGVAFRLCALDPAALPSPHAILSIIEGEGREGPSAQLASEAPRPCDLVAA